MALQPVTLRSLHARTGAAWFGFFYLVRKMTAKVNCNKQSAEFGSKFLDKTPSITIYAPLGPPLLVTCTYSSVGGRALHSLRATPASSIMPETGQSHYHVTTLEQRHVLE